MKTVKITHKEFAIEAIINNSEEIEIREGENGRFYITAVAKQLKVPSGIPIFSGFKRVFNIAIDQFVIQNEADGSCFTLAPVSKEIIENGFGRLNLDNDKFDRENFHEEVTEELEAIHEFIRMYGGFYMATFPASKGKIGTQEIARFVPGAYPWVNICYENSSDKTDVVREAKKYTKTLKNGVKFCIEYGELWDYACQSLIERNLVTFDEIVKKSNLFGNCYNNEEGEILKTGTKSEYMLGGLYGLSGCVWRWTQEHFGMNRKACRGGSFNDGGYGNAAFYRDDYCTSKADYDIGFGGVLYGSTEICYRTEMLDVLK